MRRATGKQWCSAPMRREREHQRTGRTLRPVRPFSIRKRLRCVRDAALLATATPVDGLKHAARQPREQRQRRISGHSLLELLQAREPLGFIQPAVHGADGILVGRNPVREQGSQ
jgi:hypothetical protein